MPCCGKMRAALRSSLAPHEADIGSVPRQERAPFLVNPARAANVAGRVRGSKAIFEYIGNTAMVVTCSDTGRRYHFAQAGAQMEVDSRDAATLAAIPKLRAINTV